jgi:alkylation response protein AidB-like acyl-CoA dehydrogenase
VPAYAGGLGASLADVAVACEELGHHAVPGPAAESVAAVPRLLAALDGNGPAQQWLPRLAAGELITLAAPPLLPYAADAGAAAAVLLVEGDTLWLAAPGEPRASVDPARSLSAVRGREVLARGPAVTAAAAHALEAGTLACAALLLGAGRAVLEASVAHATRRVQFGRPIGAFQAVKHQLADAAIGLEFARPLLDAAAASLDAGEPTAARDVSAAKVACTDAAYRAARTGLQVHGAIGYTQEHDLHLWLTKIRALASAWGTQSAHRGRVVAALTGAAP